MSFPRKLPSTLSSPLIIFLDILSIVSSKVQIKLVQMFKWVEIFQLRKTQTKMKLHIVIYNEEFSGHFNSEWDIHFPNLLLHILEVRVRCQIESLFLKDFKNHTYFVPKFNDDQ